MKIAIFVNYINQVPKISNSALSNCGGTDLRPQLASNHKQKLRDDLLIFHKLEMCVNGMGFYTMLPTAQAKFILLFNILTLKLTFASNALKTFRIVSMVTLLVLFSNLEI